VKDKKLFKNISVFLICCLVVVLAGLNIHQYLQIQKAKQEISGKNLSDNKAAANITDDNNPFSPESNPQNRPDIQAEDRARDDEVDDLIYHLHASEEELSVVNEQLAASEAKKAERKKLEKEYQEKHWDNGANRNTMNMVYDMQYGELFKELDLSPEETGRIKDLLYEEDIALQVLLLEYGDTSNLTVKQLEEIRQRNREIHEDLESNIETLLGESDYAAYRTFMATRNERDRIDEFSEYLDPNESLTGAQKKSLVEAMHEAVKQVEYEKSEDVASGQLQFYDEENITRVLSNYSRTNDAYLKAAAGMLSASQLKQFKAHLEEETERYRLGLEIQALGNLELNN
jgi:hypothetical protein